MLDFLLETIIELFIELICIIIEPSMTHIRRKLFKRKKYASYPNTKSQELKDDSSKTED